jgi:hypothetical protein
MLAFLVKIVRSLRLDVLGSASDDGWTARPAVSKLVLELIRRAVIGT